MAVQQGRNPVLGGIVALLLVTGARKREAMDARWDYIDWSSRIWIIQINKSGVARYAPLSDGALLLLRQRQLQSAKDCLWVFANPKSLKSYSCITNAWATARICEFLVNLRKHDLGHSFASSLVNDGRLFYEVQGILGHSTGRMTERYTHLAQDILLQATNADSGIIEGSIS